MNNEDDKPEVDANAIVSPKNTEKLYGDKQLDQDLPRPGEAEDTPTSLPEDIDDVEENLFPSAP
ncbi:hypothetical protein KW800_02390 [Candidatus Parcubacteria bacterium]|nr:hypothetical protein [Candidatus Parcubacteria bacterium]